jgi:phosphinothricin acetyltransferase
VNEPTNQQPEVVLRHAILEDAAAIAEIYNDAILHTTATFDTSPKTAEERRAWLATHDERHPVLVAEIAGQVVGWASLTRWSDRPAYHETAETSCYVAPDCRGRGIGRQLKQHQLALAKQLGFHTLLARVAQGSDASLHLNRSLGFALVGTMREVGKKFGQRLDVHLLQILLD